MTGVPMAVIKSPDPHPQATVRTSPSPSSSPAHSQNGHFDGLRIKVSRRTKNLLIRPVSDFFGATEIEHYEQSGGRVYRILM